MEDILITLSAYVEIGVNDGPDLELLRFAVNQAKKIPGRLDKISSFGKYKFLRNPLALGSCHLEACRILLEAGANPNVRLTDGQHTLSYFIGDHKQSFESTKLLIDYGADVNDLYSWCVLYHRYINNNDRYLPLIKYMLNSKTLDINRKHCTHRGSECTILEYLSKEYRYNMFSPYVIPPHFVEVFVSYGADITKCTQYLNHPMFDRAKNMYNFNILATYIDRKYKHYEKGIVRKIRDYLY